MLRGKVHAIERYISRTNKGSSTFYRPIISYTFNGESIWFRGSMGSGTPLWKIGEPVELYSLDKGPEYVKMARKNQWIFPIIFGLIGLGLIIFYSYKDHSSMFFYFSIIGDVSFFLFIYLFLKRKGLLEGIFDSFLKSHLETEESLKDREIFFENVTLDKEMRKNEKVAFYISLTALAGCYYGAIRFWEFSSQKSKDYFWHLLNNFSGFNEIELYLKDEKFIGFLAFLFFSLMLTYSIFYQLKNRR